MRANGDYAIAPSGANRMLVAHAADRDRAADHALELPGRDGHAQARPGARRGLHGRAQAGRGDAADRARDRAAAGGGGRARRASSTSSAPTSRRRSSRRSWATRACASSPSPARPRSAAGCSSCARRGVVSASMELGGNAPFIVLDDADLDVGDRRRDGGEDAQRRRGLHGRQPLPRPRVGRRGRSPTRLTERDGRRARRAAASPTAPSSAR